MNLDADLVFPNIWQGAAPPGGDCLRGQGFQVLVLCAEEYQPSARYFPGVTVIHAPNHDCHQLTRAQLQQAMAAARQVASAFHAGQKILVTCRMGLNRSGLVSALAIHLITGWPGGKCVREVQRRREYGLSNRHFVELIKRLPEHQSATVTQDSSYARISSAL